MDTTSPQPRAHISNSSRPKPTETDRYFRIYEKTTEPFSFSVHNNTGPGRHIITNICAPNPSIYLVSPKNRPRNRLRSVRFGFGYVWFEKKTTEKPTGIFDKKSKNRPSHFRFIFATLGIRVGFQGLYVVNGRATYLRHPASPILFATTLTSLVHREFRPKQPPCGPNSGGESCGGHHGDSTQQKKTFVQEKRNPLVDPLPRFDGIGRRCTSSDHESWTTAVGRVQRVQLEPCRGRCGLSLLRLLEQCQGSTAAVLSAVGILH